MWVGPLHLHKMCEHGVTLQTTQKKDKQPNKRASGAFGLLTHAASPSWILSTSQTWRGLRLQAWRCLFYSTRRSS